MSNEKPADWNAFREWIIKNIPNYKGDGFEAIVCRPDGTAYGSFLPSGEDGLIDLCCGHNCIVLDTGQKRVWKTGPGNSGMHYDAARRMWYPTMGTRHEGQRWLNVIPEEIVYEIESPPAKLGEKDLRRIADAKVRLRVVWVPEIKEITVEGLSFGAWMRFRALDRPRPDGETLEVIACADNITYNEAKTGKKNPPWHDVNAALEAAREFLKNAATPTR